MAFKRPKTGYYYTELTLPGYGKLRRLSLGTKRKSEAKALEDAILEVYRRGRLDPRLFQILDALQGEGPGRRGRMSPDELLVAVRDPAGTDAGLERLFRRLDDPPLAEVVALYLAGGHTLAVTREDRLALPRVCIYAEREYGTSCPISVLADASTVERLLHAIEAGEKKLRNSVVRYEKRGISKLLVYRYGRYERDRIMADVHYEQTDDRRRLRESIVTPEAIQRLCAELEAGYQKTGDEAAPLYVWIAVATGAETSPLSRAKNRDWNPEAGELLLRGTKRIKDGTGRDRPLRLPAILAAEVDRYYQREDPEGLLFPLAKTRFDTMFMKARRRAGLDKAVLDAQGNPTPLRPHDLRQVFAAVAERAGVPRTVISVAGLGHRDLAMTDRYLHRETTFTHVHLDRIMEELAVVTVDGQGRESTVESTSTRSNGGQYQSGA